MPFRGSPTSPFLCPRAVGHAQSAPPLLPTFGLRTRLGRSAPVLYLVPVCRGVPGLSAQGLPPVPLLRASSALLGGGSLPPSSPQRPLALGAGCCLGGLLVFVCPVLVPRTPCARWVPLPVLVVTLVGGFPCWASRGSPLSLSARPGRALLGGGSPSPFPSSLAARVRRTQLFGGSPVLCCC